MPPTSPSFRAAASVAAARLSRPARPPPLRGPMRSSSGLAPTPPIATRAAPTRWSAGSGFVDRQCLGAGRCLLRSRRAASVHRQRGQHGGLRQLCWNGLWRCGEQRILHRIGRLRLCERCQQQLDRGRLRHASMPSTRRAARSTSTARATAMPWSPVPALKRSMPPSPRATMSSTVVRVPISSISVFPGTTITSQAAAPPRCWASQNTTVQDAFVFVNGNAGGSDTIFNFSSSDLLVLLNYGAQNDVSAIRQPEAGHRRCAGHPAGQDGHHDRRHQHGLAEPGYRVLTEVSSPPRTFHQWGAMRCKAHRSFASLLPARSATGPPVLDDPPGRTAL